MEGFLILLGLLVGIGGPIGLIVGFVGFARGGRALRQVEELRRQMAHLTQRVAELTALAARGGVAPPGEVAQAAPVAGAPPEMVPEAEAGPVAEPVPQQAPVEEEMPEWVRARVPVRGSVPATAPAPGETVPEPVAEPVAAEAAPAVPEPPRRRVDVEELLTLKWGVWLGGVALLAAGIFLVRYAVEQELLGPAARCALAALLGAALIGAAEWLGRRSEPVPNLPQLGHLGPDYAPPALAAGGVAVIFGAAYGFGVYYELVPMGVAFVMLAVASFLGMALSLRFGQLVAAIGIVGAFATPILASTGKGSVPGLFGYLTVVTGTALLVVRYRAWVWLGWSTTIACGLWVLMAAAWAERADAWAPGLFVAAAAGLNLFLLPREALAVRIGRMLAWVPYAVLGCAGLILYLAQPDWAVRMGVLLLIPLAIWKGAREPALDKLPWLSVAFFLGVLLFWALPAWQPTGEIVATQEMVQAILPGAWAPDVIQPLLFTAAIVAALYAAAGLWQERAAARPLVWCALGAGVPPLTLAVTYAQVELFQRRPLWAVCAAVLALAQGFAADRARREDFAWPLQRAGIHAAGSVASLCLGCAMILGEQWLTMAIALFLPALAMIAAKAELPPLRWVALAVAGLVLTRLLLNWYVVDYAFGGWPIVNTLLLTYGVPAACFWYAAVLFRRQGDDIVVAVLESGAAAFVTVLVALEIRHWSHGGDLAKPGTGFLECALHVCSLGVLALVFQREAERQGRVVLQWVWQVQGTLALLGAGLLILANPMIGDARVYGPPVFNDLLLAYLVPAALAGVALTRPAVRAMPQLSKVLGSYALVAVFFWITLEVRHLFHPGRMNLFIFGPGVEDAELWSWSGGWLLYGIALMVAGIRFQIRALRLAAISVIGLTALKVFIIDMGGLTGLWRVLSFLGLGLTLIGLGAVFRRFVAGGGKEQEAAGP